MYVCALRFKKNKKTADRKKVKKKLLHQNFLVIDIDLVKFCQLCKLPGQVNAPTRNKPPKVQNFLY